MDKNIAKLPYKKRGILNICDCGIAYQRDMSKKIIYSKRYYNIYVNYEKTKKSRKINLYRRLLVSEYCGGGDVLDVGAGIGTFGKHWTPFNLWGYDINPYCIKRLKELGRFWPLRNKINHFNALTFWDSLEHIPSPHKIFDRMSIDSYVFVSIPIVENFNNIENYKHWHPNEHYYYFTKSGLIYWMGLSGFNFIRYSDQEMQHGREFIGTFVFRKFKNEKQ